MKQASTLFALGLALSANAQLINGSFEDNGAFSLAGWEWTCEQPEPVQDAPVDGGVWSASKEMGNVKGCFPSYLFQRIPFALDGEVWTLSGWVRSDSVGWNATPRMGFSSLSDGLFTIQSQIGTNAPYWSYVWIVDTVHASASDTAVVLLTSGTLAGPAFGAGWFDGLELAPVIPTGLHGPSIALHLFLDEGMVLHLSAGDRAIRSVHLFDATGRSLPVHMRGAGQHGVSIETSTLNSGVHIVRAITDAGYATARFVKH